MMILLDISDCALHVAFDCSSRDNKLDIRFRRLIVFCKKAIRLRGYLIDICVYTIQDIFNKNISNFNANSSYFLQNTFLLTISQSFMFIPKLKKAPLAYNSN